MVSVHYERDPAVTLTKMQLCSATHVGRDAAQAEEVSGVRQHIYFSKYKTEFHNTLCCRGQ